MQSFFSTLISTMTLLAPGDGCILCQLPNPDNCASYFDQDGCLHTTCHAADGSVSVYIYCDPNNWNEQRYGGGSCATYVSMDEGIRLESENCTGIEKVRRVK